MMGEVLSLASQSSALSSTKELIQIHNIISTADVKQAVDIVKFNDYSWGRYDIENNYNGRASYIKDTKMQGRVTIFTTGKMISTGARNIPQSIHQLDRALNLPETVW